MIYPSALDDTARQQAETYLLDKYGLQAQVETPTFSPVPGTYGSAQSVTIGTATSEATIRYTTDGSTPSQTNGSVYSTPVNISTTTTLRAIAYKSGMMDSSVTTGVYTITSPPTFVNAGAVASNAGAITPALPASLQTNDILLLFLETANQAISITNQNGGAWTEVTNSPQSTTGTRLTVFWSRYNGTQGAPTTSDSGNHQLGRIIAIRGAATSGDPSDVTAGGVEATSDTSGSIPGATTTVANTLVVTAIATDLPDATSTAKFSDWNNADLAGLTERTDNTTNVNNGGGLAIATGEKATAGAYGNTAVTLVNAAVKAMISIAIKP